MALLTRYGASASILPISGMEAPTPAESIRSDLPDSLRHAVRIWPHLYDTEGAFVALWANRLSPSGPRLNRTQHSGSAARQTIPPRWKPVRP